MTITGTTGTGLDSAVTLIAQDYGLNMAISGAAIREGAAAADGMNFLIVEAITRLGLANDAVISTSDVYAINSYLRGRHLATFTALHGDDEGSSETGFHAVQNDGGVTRLFGENAVDTVLDGIYHIAFAIEHGHFVNEDGNFNASVSDVAYWLNEFLAPELAAGTLANANVDPYVRGTTGTGLDRLTQIIVSDPGLNANVPLRQINDGAAAADRMSQIIVDAIRATGVADDGTLTELDMYDLHDWIVANHSAEWMALHGDDETVNGVHIESGFHFDQHNGGESYLFGERAVDTVADQIFDFGFPIVGDRFLNEDGNPNGRLSDIADWLTVFLADDLASGALASNHAPVTLASLSDETVYRRAAVVADDGNSGALDIGNSPSLDLNGGTIALNFMANHPDDGMTHVIFSKDGASQMAGDITAFISNGSLYLLMQDGTSEHWMRAEGVTIEAGQQYSLAITFGPEGLSMFLDGERVAVDLTATGGLEANDRRLVLGGSTWSRDAAHPDVIWDHLDGTVSNFTAYNRILDHFELAAINTSGSLPPHWTGTAVQAGDQPAVLEGTGLVGEVFNRATSFASIDDLIAQAATTNAQHHFTASTVDFGGFDEVATLGEFFDGNATLTDGGETTAMNTIGMRLTGYVWLDAGTHLMTVRSDDGFLLRLGGDEVSNYQWGRGFSATSQAIAVPTSGLYAIELYYFENSYSEGLRLEMDGEVLGADHLFASVADYQAALIAHGAMPPEGLQPVYDGPLGTTGTGLDQLVRMIGEDQGLANNISTAQIAAGAAAADAINHMIVDAIGAIGALDDGHISVAETYDISDYIRAHDYAAFVAAHGDDENGSETGFHLVQNDGGASYLFGEDAVNTVMDGIYHIGFDTMWDRFLNEDGNANARVETVTYWLNELLGSTPLPPPGTGPVAGGLGTVSAPNVVVQSGLNSRLSASAASLTLGGTASNGTGNALANTINGNDYNNVIDGGAGNDLLRGQGGDDVLVGGAGADEMIGGDGNDIYWVENRGDVIREASGTTGGIDTMVLADGVVAAITLFGGIENLTVQGRTAISVTGSSAANHIIGGGGADRIDGDSGDDNLEGGVGADRLLGGAGHDWLDGGSGIDTMTGGLGHDSYVVDSAQDRVVELAGEGNDTVYAEISYTLGATVENLVLWGDARNATGNAGDNRIDGNWYDNQIDGGQGADRMAGGYGNDRYLVDNTGDRVIEEAGNGIDTVVSSASFTLGHDVENLVITGTANRYGTGNAGDNALTGNAGANALDGRGGADALRGQAGDDQLTGGLGADRLNGGTGADRFIFTALGDSTVARDGRDSITDFSHADGDLIDLHLIDANGSLTGNGAFHLAASLDGTAGALTVSASGTQWLVTGDTNGDRVADFAILVTSATTLVAADFVL